MYISHVKWMIFVMYRRQEKNKKFEGNYNRLRSLWNLRVCCGNHRPSWCRSIISWSSLCINKIQCECCTKESESVFRFSQWDDHECPLAVFMPYYSWEDWIHGMWFPVIYVWHICVTGLVLIHLIPDPELSNHTDSATQTVPVLSTLAGHQRHTV